MKRGEDTILPNWVISAACKLPGSAGPVLLAIARRAHYRDCTVKLGYLMDETDQGERTVQKALHTLRELGHIVSADGEHVLYGACSRHVRRVCKNVHPQQGLETVPDEENPSLNKGIKEERNKNTPQPPTAQPADAGEGQDQEDQPTHEEQILPTSQAAVPEVPQTPTVAATAPATQAVGGTSARAENHNQALSLLALWNEHRGPLPRADLTDKRVPLLARAAEVLGDHAAARWAGAVREVAQDPYWRKKKYGLDNFLAGQKYVARAEAWAQRHPEAQIALQAETHPAAPSPEAPAQPTPASSFEIDWDNVRPPTGRYAFLARHDPTRPLPPELQ